jgi:hypothetical protein
MALADSNQERDGFPNEYCGSMFAKHVRIDLGNIAVCVYPFGAASYIDIERQ